MKDMVDKKAREELRRWHSENYMPDTWDDIARELQRTQTDDTSLPDES